MPYIDATRIRGPKRAKRFTFGTKAETLSRLAPLVTASRVLPLYYFAATRWAVARRRQLRAIQMHFPNRPLIVRSSGCVEDGPGESMAGRFKSLQGIASGNAAGLEKAIETVLSSLPDTAGNQVLVQPLLRNIAVSGVIASHVIGTGAPYYVLNYDDMSGRTDTVTGGIGASKAVYVFRDADPTSVRSARVRRWVAIIRELEHLTGQVPIEMEFAQARNGKLYLLQVRRISESARSRWQAPSMERFRVMLKEAESCLVARSAPRQGLLGRTTILGEMSDWNPVEIIGAAPRTLASSLYRMLVTDRAWRDARASMGYRVPEAESLMCVIGNRPFIDIRNSFNSFLPNALDEPTGRILVDAWLQRLRNNPHLHDKVEFEIAQTALDFSFAADFRERYPGLLPARALERYRSALRDLTATCLVAGGRGTLELNLRKVGQLERNQRRRARPGRPAQWEGHPLQDARMLLEECITLGTTPFAAIARHAFIAEALLRSAVKRAALAPERLEAFKRSLRTVASDLITNMRRASASPSARRIFLARFGHLRPGMYDILSARYDEQEDLLDLVDRDGRVRSNRRRPFALTASESRSLGRLLKESLSTATSPDQLIHYSAAAIKGRERAKFVFSKNLSDALLLIRTWGEIHGISVDELANIPIEAILDCFVKTPLTGVTGHLKTLAAQNAGSDAIFGTIPLSYLICDRRDIYVVPIHRSAPNFVTTARVLGPTRHLARWQRSPALRGSIVCIENADPGFDWIFVHGIAGLITQYGGANSHMMIRCAELGLAAAIGVGEHQFQRVIQAAKVDLNCRDQRITPIC